MKKNKHILININEDQYNILKELASKDNRSITNYCYLIINKYLEELKK